MSICSACCKMNHFLLIRIFVFIFMTRTRLHQYRHRWCNYLFKPFSNSGQNCLRIESFAKDVKSGILKEARDGWLFGAWGTLQEKCWRNGAILLPLHWEVCLLRVIRNYTELLSRFVFVKRQINRIKAW